MNFWTKDRPILSVTVEKTLKDTGTSGRPFYSKIGETKKIRVFGVLVYKLSITGNFPEPIEKE
jgi:hypothetical protein